jgi:hypothetical protein
VSQEEWPGEGADRGGEEDLADIDEGEERALRPLAAEHGDAEAEDDRHAGEGDRAKRALERPREDNSEDETESPGDKLIHGIPPRSTTMHNPAPIA